MAYSSRVITTNEATAALRTVVFAVWNTDGTEKTDLAASTARLYENGAYLAASTNDFEHIDNGRYALVLTQTEVNKAAKTHLLIGPANGSGYVVQPAEVMIDSAPLTDDSIADEVQTRTIAAVTTVNGLAANAITATSIAANAITDAKINSGAITSAKFAAGAINAAAIAADAITAAKVATDAVAEIASAAADATRDDFIAMLQEGVTIPATSGTMVIPNSAGVNQNVTITTSGSAEGITATT